VKLPREVSGNDSLFCALCVLCGSIMIFNRKERKDHKEVLPSQMIAIESFILDY